VKGEIDSVDLEVEVKVAVEFDLGFEKAGSLRLVLSLAWVSVWLVEMELDRLLQLVEQLAKLHLGSEGRKRT